MPHVNAVVQNYLRNVVYPTDSSTDLTTNISRLLKDATHSGTPNQKFQRLFSNTYAKQVLAEPSLVALWRFNDAVGATSAKDYTAGGNNASLSGSGITLGQTAAPVSDGATAALFDGVAGIATVTDNAALHVGDTFTIELWLKRTSAGLGTIVILFNGGTNTPSLAITTGDVIQCSISGGANNVDSGSTKLTDTTKWHHIAWTKNGAASANLYLDAVDVSTNVVNQTMSNTGNITLGAIAGVDFFPGSLANIAFYSTALSATTIAGHYALRP